MTHDWPQFVGNLLIHGLVLIPLLMLVVTAARLVVVLYTTFNNLAQIADAAGSVDTRLGTPTLVAGVCALGILVLIGMIAVRVAFSSIASALGDFRTPAYGERVESDKDNPIGLLNRRIASSLLMASLLLSIGVQPVTRWIGELIEKAWSGPNTGSLFSFRSVVEDVLPDLTLLSWPNFLAHVVILGGLMAWWASRSSAGLGAAQRRRFRDASLAAGVTGGVLLVLLEALFHQFSMIGRLDLLATFIPPLTLLTVVAGIVVAVAVMGRTASDQERAWCARLGGLLTMRAIYWSAGMATIFYLPGIVYAAGGLARALIASGWLATAVLGLLALGYDQSRTDASAGGWLVRWATLSAVIFFAGLLGATALLVSFLANMPSLTAPGGDDISAFSYYLLGVEQTQLLTLVLVATGSGIVYWLARRLIDVNLFSLTAVDSDRLAREYLAASRPITAWRQRWSAPRDQRVTVGAPSLSAAAAEQTLAPGTTDAASTLECGDDLELRDLQIGRERGEAPVYWGPQLLFNTTAVAAENDEAGCHRGDESFTLSPLYCGSTSFGYTQTETLKDTSGVRPHLWLSPTAALAGSARESSMSGPLKTLATLFSVRAGWWLEKPKMAGWEASGPRVGELPVKASAGLDHESGNFLYLTGGVQFESLGVYELVRRRCRYVIAIAGSRAGESPGVNLPQLIRRCQTDFGIRIKIEGTSFVPAGPSALRTTPYTIGQIHYGDVDAGAPTGVLIYVTLGASGREPPDAQASAHSVTRTDREPVDFWRAVEDDPFECCRALGDNAARCVFGEAIRRLSELAPQGGPSSASDYVQRLFTIIADRPTDPPKSERAQAPERRDVDRHEAARQSEPASEVQSEPPAHPPSGGRSRNRGGAQPGADSGPSRRS